MIEMLDDGTDMKSIARELDVSYDTVRKAVRDWHTAHELPLPDFRFGRRARGDQQRDANHDQGEQAVA